MALRSFLLALCAVVARAQEVPLELGLHQELILRVEAVAEDGRTRPLRMLLDTGSVQCLLDPAAAKGLVLPAFAQVRVGGFAGGERPALARRLRELRSGEAVQPDLPVLVMGLAAVNRWLDHPVDGILGMGFLAGRRFTVDAARGVLRWDGATLDGRKEPLVFKPGDPRPWMALRLGGRPFLGLADTGAGVALVAPEGTPQATLLPECDTVAAVDGTRTVREARVDAEAFGERFGGRRAVLAGSHPILGVPFLLAGPATFDLKQGSLILALRDGRLPKPDPASEGARTLPMAWNRTGAEPFLEVDDLPRCHRWHRAGFRTGDRVLAAGPLEGATLTLEALDHLLRQGRILAWTLQRGRKRVTLANPNEDPRLEPLDAPAAVP